MALKHDSFAVTPCGCLYLYKGTGKGEQKPLEEPRPGVSLLLWVAQGHSPALPQLGLQPFLTPVLWGEQSCGCLWEHPGSKIRLGTSMAQQGSSEQPLLMPCHLRSFRSSVWCVITGGAASRVSPAQCCSLGSSHQ